MNEMRHVTGAAYGYATITITSYETRTPYAASEHALKRRRNGGMMIVKIRRAGRVEPLGGI
jgi:hypothetical protein